MSQSLGGKDIKKGYDRRRRIEKMKLGIIGFIVVLMLLVLVVSIFLLIKVFGLQRQINGLDERLTTVESQIPESGTVDSQENLSDGQASADADASGDLNNGPYGVTEHQEIYLTFDDGPSENTEKILDILDQYNVKATFFVIGKEDEESQALYKEIVDRGHTLGMHSYSHKYSELYASLESFQNEVSKESHYLYEITGKWPWLFRFPGGSSNLVSNVDMADLINYLNEQDITYFDWNVSGGDATSQAYTVDDVLDNVNADIGKYETAVILLHDTNAKDVTVEALPELLDQLTQRDADIKAIDHDTKLVQHVSYDSIY